MTPLQVPGAPELAIVLLIVALPTLAGYLAYRTGKAAGDGDAIVWAAVVASLSFLGFLPGLLVLAAYSYARAG